MTEQASQSQASQTQASQAEQEATHAKTEVIRFEEAARARSFGRGVTVLCTLGLGVGVFHDLEPNDRIAILVATGILWIAGASIWWRARDPARFTRRMFRLFGVASAVSALVLVNTLGVFSPIPVILMLGMSFFVQGRDARVIYPVSIGVVALYGILALLVTIGVLPDKGVWRRQGSSEHVTMMIIVTATMATQVALARSSHRALHNAITRSQEAMRVARTREAQLVEAHENLDAALRAGHGGRLTGTMLERYRVGDLIGRGAMGEVYLAKQDDGGDPSQPSTAVVVAIKVLRAHQDDVVTKRFAREAEIARKVKGPNLVEVLATGQAADGSPFIVMELLKGQDLAAILREEHALPLVEVVELVEDAAKGLAILHAAGVVHRDLKPQNLFLATHVNADGSGDESKWKILDYGVSKISSSSGTIMTENNLVGTPGYMSPEQAEGREGIDLRSDVFSLGAVAYRALTGRRPFSGPDTPQILYQVVHGTPIRPSELVPSLPKDVEIALATALAKKPGDRFATAEDFASSLRSAFKSSLEAPRGQTKQQPPQPQHPSSQPSSRRAASWRTEPTTLTMPRTPERDVKSSRRDAFVRPPTDAPPTNEKESD